MISVTFVSTEVSRDSIYMLIVPLGDSAELTYCVISESQSDATPDELFGATESFKLLDFTGLAILVDESSEEHEYSGSPCKSTLGVKSSYTSGVFNGIGSIEGRKTFHDCESLKLMLSRAFNI